MLPYMAKRDFANLKKLRSLRRGDYPGLLGEGECISLHHPYQRVKGWQEGKSHQKEIGIWK